MVRESKHSPAAAAEETIPRQVGKNWCPPNALMLQTAGLASIPGVAVFGDPQLWAFAFGAEGVDMHRVAALMGKRGWMCGPTTQPNGIHMMPTPVHESVAAEYVAAIAECVALVREGDATGPKAAAYN